MEAEKQFIKKANKHKPKADFSGSCAIIVLLINNEVYIANVGDSR
jgi:serine/threonine protein phosphatase PrpC